MKGIILAAGRGSRLNKLTESNPKPLVTLAGQTLFEWQMAAMALAGIEDVTVMTGYLGEQFSSYNVNCINNPRWHSSNMVRTLMYADHILAKHPCIVSYGDIVYHPDIVNVLTRSQGNIVISYDTAWHELWSLRFDDPLDDAESFMQHQGELIDIGRKVNDIEQITGQYMGLLLIRPKGWSQIKRLVETMQPQRIDALDMTSLLNKLLEHNIVINTVAITGRWLEVDDLTDLSGYRKMIAKNQSWQHDWRWRDVV